MAKSDTNLLTQAAYSRSRKARGLSGGSKEGVRKAVDQGRITAFGPDKLIDPVLADAQWERNTRARVSQSAPDATPAPQADLPIAGEGEAGEQPSATPAEPAARLHADPGYLQSRSKQAAADARRAEIELAELEGSLIRVDQVKAELAGRLAPVREGLLQIPARLAPVLAAQSDAGRIQTLLEAEIHQVLSPLVSASIEPGIQ
jgi:hypothetical protein